VSTTTPAAIQIKAITPDLLLSYVEEEATKAHQERAWFNTHRVADLHNKSAYGAFVGREMAGFAVLLDGTGHLDLLHVSPKHRTASVSAKLITELAVTGLMVEKENALALDVYTDLGFTPVSDFNGVLHMERFLP
jgi:ribosomal protein S18 acetylase RimI-like enzyme